MKPGIYTKLFQRAVPLVIIQEWYRGEKSDPRQYTKNSQPTFPYLVFERSNRVTTVFFDQKGIEWIKKELLDQAKEDPTFISRTALNFKTHILRIQDILIRDQALSKDRFRSFLQEVRKTWPWFEAVWWLIEGLEGTGQTESEDFRTVQDARKYGELFFSNSCSVTQKTLEKMYPKQKKYADVLLEDEIISEKIPASEVLEKRLSHFFYTDDQLFVGADQKSIEKKYGIIIEKNPAMTCIEFIGVCSFPGKAVGKVRKVIDRNQNRFFQQGEIMVSPTTMPDLLPSMQKAGAIISDEGGLISHAAIIARELKKPCIIGTKNAFDQLKDGDLVEVDAEKGLIKLIKKEK